MTPLESAIYGFIGGIVRGAVGILKLKSIKEFKPWYLLLTLVLSGIVGVFAGMIVGADYRLTLMAGYAGMDLVESIYKIYKKRFGV